MSEPELEPVPVTILEERDASYKFRDAEGREAFFPKSEVTFKRRNVKTGEAVALVPLWLLKKKEW